MWPVYASFTYLKIKKKWGFHVFFLVIIPIWILQARSFHEYCIVSIVEDWREENKTEKRNWNLTSQLL